MKKRAYIEGRGPRHGPRGAQISPAQFARLKLAIPADTRDTTGTLMDDPLPGRSALDRLAVVPMKEDA